MATTSNDICSTLEDIDQAVDQIATASMLQKPALIEKLVPKIQAWAHQVTERQCEQEYRLDMLEGQLNG